MKHVVVHIDRLVLKGFRPEDRHAIAVGLELELGRVFADRDAVTHLGAMRDVSRLQVGGVLVGQGSTPRRVGESVAQGIGREIRK